jgi:uncharacterized flavoprotein (TIGR03862 family)
MTSSPNTDLRIAIIGSGPSGLMAAGRLAGGPGIRVDLYERRAGFGRKLLVAGSSGLNISHELPADVFAAHYSGGEPGFWSTLLSEFGPKEWIAFIERELGLETFLGTSSRYFVREMKASGLLAAWRKHLEAGGVRMHRNSELTDFSRGPDDTYRLFFGEREVLADRVVFALGGGSWEDTLPRWPELFRAKGLSVSPFAPANVGYTVAWSTPFLAETEGKPLKKIRFGNRRGQKDGELVVTKYGLEGTPVYFLGEPGPAWIDLKPDLTEAAILSRLEAVRENLAPIRRVKQKLELCEASLALLFHHVPEADRRDLRTLVARVKRFPITLGEPRPLAEAISSTGGIAMSEVDANLEFRKFPGAYAAGEMLDWHAPTGGFLIQAAVSMGARIAAAIRKDALARATP